jgi:serine/threonine protein kinase
MFIVMDCYEGESLKYKIESGSLPIDKAIDIATQVAQGLSKAHESGIVHRDIKPANIMIGKDGIARIVDFGLAKLSGQTMLTKSGRMVGTAAYMSPEQARGEKVDHRTDIWSLGVVLYEMLTGKRPFESEYEQALVYSILNQDPKPMRELRPEVPEAMEKICRRAMAKDSKDRYQTASEVLADLESYKTGTQLSRQTRRLPSKKRALFYAALAAIAADAQGLIRTLRRFEASEVHTVYEAGPTGYWLHDALMEVGFDSMVTPPSLVPHVGGRVKTDHRDSKKLASMLAGGFLKRVHVLTSEERAHRQCAVSLVPQSKYLSKQSVALVPPNPKLLDRA